MSIGWHFNPLRRSPHMGFDRFPRSLIHSFVLLAIATAQAPAQELDTARALSALRDAALACAKDAGSLWNRSVCGPIALVDRQSRLVIANDTVPGKHFIRLGDAYVTT